ncbi:hypothetical protein M0802_011251 [Mischocyttarus mexicanus]|nr:hypothetical protein M0802_011251 [Mischocyttarus mexicanus]
MSSFLNITKILLWIMLVVTMIVAMPVDKKDDKDKVYHTTPRPNIIVGSPRLCPPGQHYDANGTCRDIF